MLARSRTLTDRRGAAAGDLQHDEIDQLQREQAGVQPHHVEVVLLLVADVITALLQPLPV